VVEFGEWFCSHVLKMVPHRAFRLQPPEDSSAVFSRSVSPT
jgi:hypothetical protein